MRNNTRVEAKPFRRRSAKGGRPIREFDRRILKTPRYRSRMNRTLKSPPDTMLYCRYRCTGHERSSRFMHYTPANIRARRTDRAANFSDDHLNVLNDAPRRKSHTHR